MSEHIHAGRVARTEAGDDLILIGKITRTQGHHGEVRLLPFFEPMDNIEQLKTNELLLRFPSGPDTTRRTAQRGMRKGKGEAGAGAGADGTVRGSAPQAQGPRAGGGTFHLTTFFYHQQFIILQLEEIGDMSAAERVVGAEVLVHEQDLWELAEGEYLAYQLVGLAIRDETSGEEIGVVTEILPGPAHDYLSVERSGHRFLVPLVKEFVRNVDIEQHCVRVHLPPGLDEV